MLPTPLARLECQFCCGFTTSPAGEEVRLHRLNAVALISFIRMEYRGLPDLPDLPDLLDQGSLPITLVLPALLARLGCEFVVVAISSAEEGRGGSVRRRVG